LSDVAAGVTKPSQELLDLEASCLKEMNDAREALLAAIFEQIETGSSLKPTNRKLFSHPAALLR